MLTSRRISRLVSIGLTFEELGRLSIIGSRRESKPKNLNRGWETDMFSSCASQGT